MAVRSEGPGRVDEKPHRKLKVWKASVDFVIDLYGALEKFPAYERFGLAAQLQRAAVSIPSNIAEGAARKNTKELLHFLHIGRGSISEIDTQLEISFRLGHLDAASYAMLSDKLDEISRMLNGLVSSLARKS
jgi:four helix bundle protein